MTTLTLTPDIKLIKHESGGNTFIRYQNHVIKSDFLLGRVESNKFVVNARHEELTNLLMCDIKNLLME